MTERGVTKLSGRVDSTLAGDIFVLSGALVSAFSGIATKRTAGRIHPVALICWQCWLSWPFLALLSWWLESGRPFVFTARAVTAILYLGLISAAFGFVAFAWLIQRNSATRVTALTFLAPVFGVVYSWFFFGETFTPVQILGVLGVCVGVYVVNTSRALQPPAIPATDTSRAQQDKKSKPLANGWIATLGGMVMRQRRALDHENTIP